MSGIIQHSSAIWLELCCDRCDACYRTEVFAASSGWGQTDRLRSAWAAGWRVFVGGRSQHTYCPDHGPTVAMRLILPKQEGN